MRRWLLLLTALCLLFLSACDPWNGEPNPEALDLMLVEDSSWFSDYEIRGETVRLTCELTLENHTDGPLSGCLLAWFTGDVGTLVRENRLPGFLASEAEAENPTSQTAPGVLEFQPGKTTIRVVFVGTFAGDPRKQDRLLPQLYWAKPDGSGEIVLPMQ